MSHNSQSFGFCVVVECVCSHFFGNVYTVYVFSSPLFAHYGQMRYRFSRAHMPANDDDYTSISIRLLLFLFILFVFFLLFVQFWFTFSMSSLFSSAFPLPRTEAASIVWSDSSSCHLNACVIYIYFVLIIFCLSLFSEYCIRLASFVHFSCLLFSLLTMCTTAVWIKSVWFSS